MTNIEELDALVAADDLEGVEAWIQKHKDKIYEIRAAEESEKSRKAALKALKEMDKKIKYKGSIPVVKVKKEH